jgi:hypothetical protein
MVTRLFVALVLAAAPALAQRDTARVARAVGNPDPRTGQTEKPPLHAKHWLAITGKPLSATAGAQIFARGGNAVDAAAAMLAAGCTMWDTLGCGGETQALIYDPHTKKVIGLNALGVAPTGATAAFYKSRGFAYPPEYGPLAAVTPGTVGGLLTMLAEWGKLSLKEVLAPAIQMADGYAIEAQLVRSIAKDKSWITQWKYSPAVFLPNASDVPEPGQVFVQRDLAAMWRKLVEGEQQALKAGKSRKQAIYAAYDRFYKGDIAKEIVRGVREDGGLFTMEDLANWKVKIEEPLSTNYKGITNLQAAAVAARAGALTGAQHSRERRREGDGLQLAQVHPHSLSNAEPGVRRPRFLLRRPGVPARVADERTLEQGVREAAICLDRLGEERPERKAGRPLQVPGRHESVRSAVVAVESGQFRAQERDAERAAG